MGIGAYPLVDHVADKVVAILQRYGDSLVPSTRYKDLVDLVSIVTAASADAGAQTTALRTEAKRRGVMLPRSFDVPDRALWESGYAAEARRSLLASARSLDEALATVRRFLDPVFGGGVVGRWDPKAGRWIS
jgi:hypothetical protein